MKFNALNLQAVAPLMRASKGADVLDLFSAHEDIAGCAIVDEARQPIGYIDRLDFITRISSLYGRALYDKRPADTLASQNYRVVKIDSDIAESIGLDYGVDTIDRTTGLIVVDEAGAYLGLTHAFTLTRVLLKKNETLIASLKKEIEDRKAAERAVRDMADRDELTGVFNRRRFMQELNSRVDAAQPLMLVYIDLDGFKKVNDTFGHSAGDFVLSTIAARLNEAAGDDLLARIGGDEFALLANAAAHRSALFARLMHLETVITQPIKRANGWLEVGASIGAAQFPQDFNSALSLIDGADQTMMAVKADGGGVRIYESDAEVADIQETGT